MEPREKFMYDYCALKSKLDQIIAGLCVLTKHPKAAWKTMLFHYKNYNELEQCLVYTDKHLGINLTYDIELLVRECYALSDRIKYFESDILNCTIAHVKTIMRDTGGKELCFYSTTNEEAIKTVNYINSLRVVEKGTV